MLPVEVLRPGLLLVFVPFALGQVVHPHLVVGVPLTRPFQDGFEASRRGGDTFRGRRSQFVAGAGLEVPLSDRFRVDAGFLYRRLAYDAARDVTTTGPPTRIVAQSSAAADRWEAPVLFRYRLLGGQTRPFLLTGGTLSMVGRLRGNTEGTEFPPVGPPQPIVRPPIDGLPNRLAGGWTSGGGLELPAGRLRLAPEVRYTFWANRHTRTPSEFRFRRHQFDFLLGFRF
jgi:hypothetical protein